jgi:3-isopropylmalate/(R)-2-methylmalate dehydratase small subunit
VSGPSIIEQVTGRAVVLRGADIDTDRIMPARFLKAISFEGLERHLFEDDRAAERARGAVHPLDRPAASGARVLLVNSNFGCGSSREHAPQGLCRFGFRAVVGESFSEIFAGNALAIGLVCMTASTEAIAALMTGLDQNPAATLAIDVRAETVAIEGDKAWPAALPAPAKQALLSGEWDATGLLLADYFEVERVEAGLPYLRTTSRNA